MKNFTKINCAFMAKKKHFALLCALLCASVMGWADCYTATQNTSENSYPLTLTVEKLSDTQTKLSVTSTHSTITGVHSGSTCQNWGSGVVADGENIINNLHTGWNHDGNVWSRVINWETYPSGNLTFYLVMYRDNSVEGADIMSTTYSGIDASQSCSVVPSKPSPELSLNASSKTLEIDASAETFQIEPTKEAGSGAVSYVSSAEGVATVSSTGLVTAVAAGTATNTVSVAENDDFAADSKTLTVEVIDWPNKGWLQNGENAYKLHISPAMGGDGQRIENGNLWVGFPSAELGAMSITPNGGEGAWRTFAPSNFPGYRSQFTVVCQGTTYTFTVYRKFDGVNLAKGMPVNAGINPAGANGSNDGNINSRWQSAGARHYAEAGDMTEDWWYVDLGAVYSIDQIKILYERACATDYDLQTSPNGDSWVNIGSYNAQPNTKEDNDGAYEVYSITPAKNARYVRIFTRNGYSNLAYGFSMYEFEVYGEPAESYDMNVPVLESAAVSGTPTSSQVQIAVSASDTEDAVTIYRIKDISHGIDHNCTVAAGVITIDGLSEGTNYSFTVTALDAIGNQSNAIVVNVSTAADSTIPQEAAPVPSGTNKEIRPVYCDAFASILAHEFSFNGFDGSATLYSKKNISGDESAVHDLASKKFVIWGMYDNGDNAIIAQDGYHSASYLGIDASEMEYLHVDIWSLQACEGIDVRVNDQARSTKISHGGGGWQSYDLPLSEYEVSGDVAKRIDNVRWLKFLDMNTITGKVAIDNVYFWKNEGTIKSINVSVNSSTMGSAIARVGEDEVTSVDADTEVTFTATPNEGYDFAYWTINGNRVYTNPYALVITENTNAVATFEPIRTAYCSTPVTDVQESRTLYLTISRTENANEYKILFEGSADNKISGDNVYVGTTLALTNVNGESSYAFTQASGQWHVSSEGFGSAYITFTATDFRDISFVSKGVDLFRDNSAGGGDLSSFNAFPDASLIKWDATCADAAAPDLAAPTATPIGPKSVRLELSATDDIAAMLTYYINYKPTGDEGEGTNVVVVGTSGETTYKNITGLTSSVDYTFSITVSDGTNTSEPQSCSATPTMPTALVPPARPEMYVRSIYSDAYATILAADFGKKSFASNELTWEEMNVSDNHCLFYDLLPHEANAAFAIGGLNPGDIFVAQEAYQGDITEKDNRTTPDVSAMTHLHVDVWSNKATQYAEVQINGFKVGGIPLDGSGWQQFDLPLETFKASHLADLKDVKYINFVGLRTPNPEEIAIDNVYFYAVPANISFGDDAMDNTTTIADNANKYANVTINRNILADDTWYTLCLPFDMSAEKVSEVFGASTIATLVSSEDRGSLIHLNFNYVNAIQAGKPYLIKPGLDFVSGTTISNVTIQNVDPSAEGYKAIATHMHFQGTFDKIMLTGEDKRYVSANNELYSPNPDGGSKIGAFRCYFTIPDNSPLAGAPGKQARIVFGPQNATGIDLINDSSKSNGKLLINGVLYIIRDGNTYNTQGMLVE